MSRSAQWSRIFCVGKALGETRTEQNRDREKKKRKKKKKKKEDEEGRRERTWAMKTMTE